jgi:coenzyme PQQ biosynthesis protein PqqD
MNQGDDARPPGARPQLASKVRLRFDRARGQHMLLYPERGMALNPSAAAIAELCNGQLRVDEIVERLHAANSGADRAALQRDVEAFLSALQARALLRFV